MIRVELPGLPPSSNNAYANMRGGHGRRLTDVGRSFLMSTKATLVQRYPREMMIFKKNKPYGFAMSFYFEHLENKGWATGKAASRYKQIDVDNRIKLLMDAFKEAGGIDDSQTLTMLECKLQGTPERTVVWAWSLEEESTPFDDPFRHLT
jgi:Holliday junction resolvase RusA-like endonuclease